MGFKGGHMAEIENGSWHLDNLIKKVFISHNRELNQIKYITEKTNYFYNLLMGDLYLKEKIDENTNLLEHGVTHEEYLAYYNNITQAICILKKQPLVYDDFFDDEKSFQEMVWEESKQYFIKVEKGMLRIDILNSYIDTDMITSYYDINDLTHLFKQKNYNTLWELISSHEFQSTTKPLWTIVSELRANINGEPKCQAIYSLDGKEKQLIMKASGNRIKNIVLEPFENHENVVETAISHQKVLKRKLKSESN